MVEIGNWLTETQWRRKKRLEGVNFLEIYNWVLGVNWAHVRQLEDQADYNGALQHTLKICEKCRRWKHSLCTGCELKTKRDELSPQTTTPPPIGKPGPDLQLW